jgi:hypothetical protein
MSYENSMDVVDCSSCPPSHAMPDRRKFLRRACQRPGRIAITMDLEMSRDYPQRGMREWDFQKGNLDEETKTTPSRRPKS